MDLGLVSFAVGEFLEGKTQCGENISENAPGQGTGVPAHDPRLGMRPSRSWVLGVVICLHRSSLLVRAPAYPHKK
jgi:hypothetical protein